MMRTRKTEEPPKPKRVRRTQLELLKLPPGAMRRINEVSELADLPSSRVFKDVIEAGLSVIRNPATSPYQSMIDFRAGLEKYQESLNETVESAVVEQVGKRAGPGESVIGVGQEAVATEVNVQADGRGNEPWHIQEYPERSGDARERPGRESETGEGDPIASGVELDFSKAHLSVPEESLSSGI